MDLKEGLKKGIAVLLLIAFSFTITGCDLSKFNAGKGKSESNNVSKDDKDGKTETEFKLEDGEILIDNMDDESSNELYEKLFDINNHILVEIKISDEELDKLQDDYEEYSSMNSKSPIYRKVDKLTITIGDKKYVMSEVGIRQKGNMSRDALVESDGKLNLSHYRLSFNETFDNEDYYDEVKVWKDDKEREKRKDRTLATLKEMELKWNRNYDETFVREYYAAEIFRKNNLLVQRMNLTNIHLNDDNYGVFMMYEPVDKIFLEKNLPEEDLGGDLYKCGWTYSPADYGANVSYGVDDKDSNEFYNYKLKTNKKTSNHETLINLLDTLNDDNITKEQYESVIDTDYMARFLAVSYFNGDPDDIRNNYNNHYLYFLKSSGKAIIIPYDNDRCLGVTYSWNPDGSGMTAESPYSDMAAGLGRDQENPIITHGILEDDFILDDYKKYLSEVASMDDWKEENFEKVYNIAKDNYEDEIEPSIDFDNQKEEFKFALEGELTSDDDSNISFENYVYEIMDTYELYKDEK